MLGGGVVVTAGGSAVVVGAGTDAAVTGVVGADTVVGGFVGGSVVGGNVSGVLDGTDVDSSPGAEVGDDGGSAATSPLVGDAGEVDVVDTMGGSEVSLDPASSDVHDARSTQLTRITVRTRTSGR